MLHNDYNKFSELKRYFISSQFCRFEIWMGSIGFYAQGFTRLKLQCFQSGLFSEGSGKEFTSKITQIVGRFKFLVGVELRSLFPCQLSVEGRSAPIGCSSIPAHGSFHLQSQQWCIKSFLCFKSLCLPPLPPARKCSLLLRTHGTRSCPPR